MRTLPLILVLLFFPFIVRSQDRDGSHEDVEARSRYRFEMRADENGEIPFNALLKAKREIDAKQILLKELPQRQPTDAGLTGWEWLGPGNIGGRIRSIVINPNVPQVMYIGSVSGGIWRTDNAGDSWYPLTDFMPSINVTSLVIDPTNPLTLYAGTGEGFGGAGDSKGGAPAPQGAGIFKSIDAGLTWNQLPSTVPSTVNTNFLYVNRLAHHPTASNILLAATSTGVLETTDGGLTWSAPQMFVNALQVKYHPSDPNRVLCGTSTDLFLSTDGGAHWTRQTTGALNMLPASPGRCEADFARTDSTIYVNVDLQGGEIWRSTDAGRSWVRKNSGTAYFGGSNTPNGWRGSQGFYDNAIWVDPTNSSIIVVGGRNLQRSTDGGATLAKIGGDTSGAMISSVHPDIHAIIAHPQYNGTTNRIVHIGCDGGIYRTADVTTASLSGGWEYLNHDLGITQFYWGASAVDGSLIAGGAQDNDRLHYTPAGGTGGWYQAGGTAPGGDGTVTAIDFSNPQRVYAAATGLSIARSDDAGRTYTPKVNGIADVGGWVAPFLIDPNNSNSLVAGGTKIWKTTDKAENWTQIRDAIPTTPFCTAIDIAQGNSNVIWLGYKNGQLSMTTNGGTSWTDFAGGARPSTAITEISINPADNAVVMVTYGGYSTNNVWLTEDGGTNWVQRTGASPSNLPAIQVNTIRFHPIYPNWVYVGTDLGVFASEDRGLTWNTLPSYAANEGPANVEVSKLFWQGNEYLIAATFGRGMYRAHPNLGIFVDLNNPNAGDGTLGNPFRSIQDGINAQPNGAPLFILTGTYQQGAATFTKRGPVRIWNGPVIIK